MKKQKTLNRLAAVAAVLLAFCLVFVAPVGATTTVSTYADLKSAFGDGGEVTLGAEIELTETLVVPNDKTVTLDLAGHEITVIKDSKDDSKHIYAIDNKGTLTIQDSVGNGEIKSRGIWNYGTLTLESGTINAIDGNGGYAVYNQQGSTFTMNGGTVTASYEDGDLPGPGNYDATALIVPSGCTATLNGGKIISVSDYTYAINVNGGCLIAGNVEVTGCFGGVMVNSGSSAEINDGTYTMTGTSGGHVIYVQGTGNLVINDGYFKEDVVSESVSEYIICLDTPSTASVTINGGTFETFMNSYNGNKPVVAVDSGIVLDHGIYVTINAGIFAVSPDKYGAVSADSMIVNTDNDKYEVVVKTRKIDSDEETLTFTGNAGSVISPKKVTITNTGNQPIKLTSISVDSEDFTVSPYGDINVDLIPKATAEIIVTPAAQAEAKEYKGVLTISTNVTAVTKTVALSFTASSPEEIEPPVFSGLTKTDDKITINPATHEAEEVGVDGVECVGIFSTENPSVVLMFPGASLENGEVNLGEESTVLATYVPVASEVDDSETPATFTAIIVMEDHTVALPTLSGEFNEDVAGAVTEAYKDYKPLSMLNATNVDAINTHLDEVDGSVIISFTISNELYQKYNGKFIVLHVKDGKVAGKIQVTPEKNTDGTWDIPAVGSSFSSYVLAADTTPTNLGNSGSATDTGSGNYQYYPRSVPTDGIVDFGTSKVVTGMELPAGSDGTVTLNIKPTFDMPENGFYAFEIDAPGYNLDAKINGGLSFQIPVADLEAAGWTAEDIVLFHGTVGEDGKIVWEALPTNLVKNENGVAYYKAAINGCSPFYIGFVKDGSVVNTEVVDPVTPETPVTPDEPEVLPPVDEPETPEQPTESPAPILAVLAGLGAAVVLRRK